MTTGQDKPQLRLDFIFEFNGDKERKMAAEAAYLQDAPVTFLPTLSVVEGTKLQLNAVNLLNQVECNAKYSIAVVKINI